MDYRIAQYLVRVEGIASDLAALGLRGFRPFETTAEQTEQPTLIVSLGQDLSSADYSYEVLHECDFDQSYATCRFGRFDGGYIVVMWQSTTQTEAVFVKRNDSNRVECNMFGEGKSTDIMLLRFGLWMMFGLTIASLGAIAIHSSVIVKDNGAVLCLGESGTGKSTHTRLWREHITGTHLLNDDSPIIRLVDGVPTAFGSPWSGKTPCYRAESFPIRGFLRLSQAPYNRIHRLPILNAIGALLPSCPPAFAYDDALQDCICDTLSSMIAAAPVYHLECLPDAAAAQMSYNTIYNI